MRGRTVEVGRPDKGNVDAEVAMVGGAVETQVDAEGDRCPGGILLAAVEADLAGTESVRTVRTVIACYFGRCSVVAGFACLVCLLRLELLKNLERLLLGRETAHLGRFVPFLAKPSCRCAVVVGVVL